MKVVQGDDLPVLIVLKTRDSEEMPDEIEARIEEHMPEGIAIGIFLDISRIQDNAYRAKAYLMHNGDCINLLEQVMVVAEKENNAA